jgi:hypothetical protein
MAISEQLNRELHNIFLQTGNYSFPDYIHPALNFSNNNIFNVFLRTDISGNEVDVPLNCRGAVEGAIYENYLVSGTVKEFSVALYENNYPQSKRTANAIFKAFQQADRKNRMLKITTNKGEVYYGGNGFILDKDYNILLLYVLHGIKNPDRTVTYKTGRIYVNPKVFVSNDLLEKGIIKTVIPAFVQEGIMVDTNNIGVTAQDINTSIRSSNGWVTQVTKPIPEIIVADVTDRFIVRPKKPTPSTFNNEAMNDYLLEHLDEVVKMTYIS